MSAVSGVSPNAGAIAEAVGGQNLGKTEFLELLIAQLENQDPLEPMDNSEFVAQLAQFSSVEQLVAVNDGINILATQLLSTNNVQASSLVGRTVEVSSDTVPVKEGDTEKSIGFTLHEDAEEVKVNIYDEDSNLVRTIELGSQLEGEGMITWDLYDDEGIKVPPDTYTLNVEATDADGEDIDVDTTITGTVTGVLYESGFAELQIGDITASLSDVLGIYRETETSP
jgi:flagellar basal-body rod modification protein FlgD